MKEKRDHKIYKYTNKVNGKVYIGRTCNTLLRRSEKDGSGYKGCTYFWNAIQKYGWENFEGEILESNLRDVEAGEKEMFYIAKFDSTNKDKGYNLLSSEYSTYSDERREKIRKSKNGSSISEETKEKLRKINLGKKQSIETVNKRRKKLEGRKRPKEFCENLSQKKKGKEVSLETRKKIREKLRNRNGQAKRVKCIETGIEYRSMAYAEECTGVSSKRISEVVNGRRKTAGGYHWCFVDWNSLSKNMANEILCVETNSIYAGLGEASRDTGIGIPNIHRALKRASSNFAGGFHWVYTGRKVPLKRTNKVKVLCIETNEEYESVTEASSSTKISASSIRRAMEKSDKYTAGGYHWEKV